MRLSILYEEVKDKITILSNKYKLDPQVIEQLLPVDPTPSKKYLEWIIKQYKLNHIRIPEDNEKINDTIKDFDTNKSKLTEKDINRYSHPADITKAIEDSKDKLSKRKTIETGRQGGLVLPIGARLIYDQGGLSVVEVNKDFIDMESATKASEILAEGTKWCVVNTKTAKDYLEDGPLYFLYINRKRTYLFHHQSGQYMDVYDKDIGDLKYELVDKISSATGLKVKDIPSLACDYAINIVKGRWPKGEPAILTSPKWAFKYIEDVIGSRWPEAEPTILKDSFFASRYASEIIKNRWPEAEKTILKDPYAASIYARNFIRGRWPEAEETILKDPYAAYYYAHHTIGGRWPEAEPIILKDPDAANQYANCVIGGRWPEAEPIILTSPSTAYYYAEDVIGGRWPEAEPTIMKDPDAAYQYAAFIIRGRWPEAEPTIMKDPEWAEAYTNMIADLD